MDYIIGSGGKSANSAGKSGAAPKDLIKESSTAAFVADVIEASRQGPVIVDFWSPRSPPSKQFDAALEKAVREMRGSVRMVKINVDQNPELAAQLRVQQVPMVYAFQDGRPVDAFVGPLPEGQIQAFLQRLTAGQQTLSIADLIAQGKEVLAEGDPQTAGQIFQEVLAEDPDNAPAHAGLLRCLLALGEVDAAKQALAQLPDEVTRHADVAAVRTALELQDHAVTVGPAADLRRRVAVDPTDHQARFDLAMAYYAGGEQEAAVDELLEIFRRDRIWNDDGARKQLVKLFEAFGPVHPLTLSGRKRLSTLLFS